MCNNFWGLCFKIRVSDNVNKINFKKVHLDKFVVVISDACFNRYCWHSWYEGSAW